MKRQLAAFLLRLNAGVAASLIIRLAADYPIAGYLAIAAVLIGGIRVLLLMGKWSLYRKQQASPHYHYRQMSIAAYGRSGDEITIHELNQESLTVGVWVIAALIGAGATWYQLN
jgi:hypothetical protein